ncbi:DUF6193 family natural product biosynthesis protein [Streptomyces sp. NRRL B-24484]|uniref:DUF6193 family natural product biosynthesis protein n=1 Tax=Streptomyces sp. NRRL B-24484 TaxID=1463833 RepID=UPI000AF6DEDD|nr:DUF6193 family natural product biosynthesis protein [Streptomyces sp. NRRL B-24484]
MNVHQFRGAPEFLVCCRKQGAWLANGRTADPAAAAAAVAAWMGGADLAAAEVAAPFLRYGDWALAHEREPLDPVELEWWHRLDHYLLSPPTNPCSSGARALLEAAHAQPRLRRLTPVTSHYTLWFSASATRPYEPVGHAVDPQRDGSFLVRSRAVRVVTTVATAEEAVALVVAGLPEE